MDMTPEEILKKHIGIAPRGNFYLIGDGVSIKEQVEKAMREYGELKQPPRWVKAKEVLKEVEEYLSEERYENGKPVHRNNIGAYSVLHKKVKSVLDESESPKEESDAVAFAKWLDAMKVKADRDFKNFPRHATTEELYSLFKQTK